MRLIFLSLFCTIGFWLNAQTTLITGIVLDENNWPVANAQIDVAGKNTNTITDDVGKFALTLRKTAKGDLIIIRTTKRNYVVSSIRQAVSELPITITIHGLKGSGKVTSKKSIDTSHPLVNAPNAQIVTMNQSGGNNTVIMNNDSFETKQRILKSTPPKINAFLTLENRKLYLHIVCLNTIPCTIWPFVSIYGKDLTVGGAETIEPITATPRIPGHEFVVDLYKNIDTWQMPKDTISRITLFLRYQSIYFIETGNPSLKLKFDVSYVVDPSNNSIVEFEKHFSASQAN